MMTAEGDGLSFDKDEAEAVRQVVSDWLNEELTAPPFPSAVESVLKKLGLAAPVLAESPSVARNEVTVKPGPRSE